MKKQELLTAHVSKDTMYEVFAANNPGRIPNKTNVGLFAKKIGYTHTKQMIDREIVWYYIKNQE